MAGWIERARHGWARRRAERLSDELLSLAGELGWPVEDGAAHPADLDAPLRVEIVSEDAAVRLELVAAFDVFLDAGVARQLVLRADARIATLLSDAASLGLEAFIEDLSVRLTGRAEPLEAARIEDAAKLAAKLAARLPVVRIERFGPCEPRPPETHASWRELSEEWELESDRGYRWMAGARDGLPLELSAEELAPRRWRTTITIDARQDELALVAGSTPDEAHPEVPFRGGFGALWVRIRDDELSAKLDAAGVLEELPDLVARPFVLVWDAEGLVLRAEALLDVRLRRCVEQLLKIARVGGFPARGVSPYR